jgi:hypothetical protein
MNVVLWILQILLALLFGAVGIVKLTQPYENLAKRLGWVNDFSPTVVRAIGFVELLGAIGLILPRLTNILPWLTPLAAVGLVLDQLGAAATHLRRKENSMIVANLVLVAIAAFIVYGRYVLAPL